MQTVQTPEPMDTSPSDEPCPNFIALLTLTSNTGQGRPPPPRSSTQDMEITPPPAESLAAQQASAVLASLADDGDAMAGVSETFPVPQLAPEKQEPNLQPPSAAGTEGDMVRAGGCKQAGPGEEDKPGLELQGEEATGWTGCGN